MKKWFFAALMMISVNAYSQDWNMITETTDGTRLIVDIDTFNFDSYENGKKYRASAVMQMVGGKNTGDSFVAAIDADECITKQSGAIVNVYADNKVDTYFWSVEGNRMYDAQGIWLCATLMRGLDEVNKKNKKDTKYM